MKYTALCMVIGSVVAAILVILLSILVYMAALLPHSIYNYNILYSSIGSHFAASMSYLFLLLITAAPIVYFAALLLEVLCRDIKSCLNVLRGDEISLWG